MRSACENTHAAKLGLLMATTALVTSLGLGPSSAQTSWIAGDGDWNTPANWSPATVPTGGREVVIDRPGTITVTHSTGTHTISRLTSQENFVLSGGSLTITGAATIAGDFTHSASTLTASGTVTVDGATTLSRSAQQAGSGDLVTNGPLTIEGVFLAGARGLDIRGGATWTTGDIAISGSRSGARITNVAGSTFVHESVGQISGTSSHVLRNEGTYRFDAGGRSTIRIAFENAATGTLEVANGRLDLLGDGTSLAGKVKLDAGTTLNVNGNAAITAIDGSGAAGTLQISGVTRFDGINRYDGKVSVFGSGATATVSTSLEAGSLRLENTLRGPGTVVVNGELELGSSATIDGATVIAKGLVDPNGSAELRIVGGGLLDVRGGANMGSGRIALFTGPSSGTGAIVNAAGSDFEIGNLVVGGLRGEPAGEFTNRGRLTVSGDAVFDAKFLNEHGATIDVRGGSLTLTNRDTVLRGRLESGESGELILAGPVPDSLGRQILVHGLDGSIDDARTSGALGTVIIRGGARLTGTNDLGSRLEISAGPVQIEGQLRTRNVRLTGGATTVAGIWQSDFGVSVEDSAVLTVVGGASVDLGSLSMRGGQITGTGDLHVRGPLNIFNGDTPAVMSGASRVFLDGQLGVSGDLRLDNGKEIVVQDSALWSRGTIDLNAFNPAGPGPDGGRILIAPGALFIADANASMLASKGPVQALFQNSGTFRRQGNGTTTTIDAPFLNDADGVVEVTGGILRLQAAQNLDRAKLSGGTWQVSGGGLLEFIGLLGILENAATIVVDGPGAGIRSGLRFGTAKLSDTLVTNTGVLDLRNGAVHEGFATLRNNGTIRLDGGILAPFGLVNAAGGVIVGDGEVRIRPTNEGTIRAAGGNLLLSRGVSGPGTLQIDPGARMVLGGTTTNETGRLRLATGASLDLGGRTLRVAKDYENAAFGVGNAFTPRANVAPGGVISSVGDTLQALVVDGVVRKETEFTLDFGLVRGGTTKTITYQIANLGTPGASTDLRGAIQNKYGRDGITDSRLSGSGVTAQNFGPIAGGSSTGTYAITLGGGAGRPLDNQSIRILNNFDDVKDQVVKLTGSTTQLANGNATAVPPSGVPVDLGRFRVNGPTVSRGFSVTNTSSEPNSERLAIGSVTTTGNFSASGISAALIDPGATRAAGFTVNVNGGVAGVNAGSARIRYESNGQRFDPGFTNVTSNVQDIALTATGYALANPNALPGVLGFGTVLRGSTQTRFLTISNDYRDAVPVGFQEGLDARFGTVTGPDGGRFTVGGAITNLAAGGVSSGALSVALDTSVVGSFSASVPVLFASNGAGTSGFGLFELGTQRLGLAAGVIEATVVNPAVGVVTSTSPIVVDARRVGDAPAQKVVAIRNAADPVAETLSARFDGTTGAATTNAASVSGLAAGAEDAVTLRVGIDTSVAGMRAGRATIAFDGDLGSPLPSATVVVQGKVYQRAAADTLEPLRLDLGVVRAGQKSTQRIVAMSNVAPIAGLNDGLTATLRSVPLAVDVALDPQLGAGGIPVGTTLNRAFTTTLRSDRVGAVSESVVLALGSTNRDMPTDPLGERVFEVVGRVNDVAAPLFDKVAGDGTFLDSRPGLRIDLGDVELGRSSQIVLSLRNAIEFGDDLAGSFDLAGLGAAVEASGFDPVRLEAGALVDDLVLTFSGRSLGSYAGFFTFDWASVYPGLADLPGSALRVDLFATVVDVAPPADVSAPGTAALLLAATGLLARARRRR